jgi:hypothetical protein
MIDLARWFVGPQAGQWFTSQPISDHLCIDSILADRPVVPSFYEGWKAQQVIQAALEADRQRRWVGVGCSQGPLRP